MARKTRVFVPSSSTLHLLHRAGQLADEAFLAALGNDGITARQFIVLDIVAREDNPSQTTICELSGIDRSTLADIVRRLVSRGLLGRKRTREDARRYAVRITDAGQKILDKAMGEARQVEDLIVGALPTNQRADFQNALRLMVEKLNVREVE